MNFTRHLDRLAAALSALAGLLPSATSDLWRPAAEVLHICTTKATPAWLHRTSARLPRWGYGSKCTWP
jgi:hypothetical protein